MNAGLMDELVTVQQFSTTTDSNTGAKLQTWSTYTTMWFIFFLIVSVPRHRYAGRIAQNGLNYGFNKLATLLVQ